MKKRNNQNLEQLAALLSVIDEESQRRILGGTAPTPTPTSPPTNPNEEDPFAIPGVTPPCPTTNPSDTGGGTTGGSPTEEPTTSDTDGDPINPYDNPDLPRSIAVPDSESDENADLPDTTTEDAVVTDASTAPTTDTATPDNSTESSTVPTDRPISADVPPQYTGPHVISEEIYEFNGKEYKLYERSDGSAYIEYSDKNGTQHFECATIINPYIPTSSSTEYGGDCPLCNSFDAANNPLGLSSPDGTGAGNTVMTELGELILKLLGRGHSENCPYNK